MSEEEQIILPKRFKRIEYLESDGNQYINTEYVHQQTTGTYIDAQSIKSGDTIIMGSGNAGSGNAALVSCYRVSASNSNTNGFRWNGVWKRSSYSTRNVRFQGTVNLYNSLTATLTVNGSIEETVNISAPDRTYTLPYFLFSSCDSNQNPALQWGGKIFEAKISEGNEIVRHFIPVYDTYLFRGCMYELIEGKAYYNKGSGDFLYDLGLEDEQLGILHKLPEGFKYVKYLIANGYQYIDTNYVPTNETGYYLEGQGYISDSTTRYYFGSNETTDWNLNQRIYFGATPHNLLGWLTPLTVTSDASKLRQETNVALNFLNSRKCITTINDADIINELADLTFTPSQKIFLFNVNLGGNVHTGGLKGRIDTFLISEGNQIVRQFVPCLDEDGILCMYELYTGTVHYNQGSGQFSYPREYTNDPINLPAGYTKCVYLQSNGTQWIDTEVIPNTDTGIYIEAQHLSYGDHPPIGSWENANSYYYPPRFNLTNKSGTYSFGTTYQMGFYYNKGDDLVFTSTMNLYNDKTVNFWSEDTNWFGIISVNFTTTFTRPLWLFSYNMDNATINATYGKFSGRIFRAKITQGDILIRDFVPCLDTDNKPCMYDLINQEPYYNQSGGVEFAYCVEHQLPSDFSKLKYLESDKTQFIKTGYIPTNNTGLYVDCYNTYKRTDWAQPFALRQTNGNTYVSAGRVQKATNGAGFGWNAYTTPGGTGDCRYEATLNWLNDKKSIISAPAFAQRVNTLSDLTFTPTIDLCLFGCHNYDGTYMTASYRIYRAKISEDSEIVRDYVPAYDALKDKPCMYDLINNVAYYNDGTGEFVMPSKREGSYTGFAQLGGIGNRLGGGEIIRGVLPENTDKLNVTLLEYLTMGGNECVDTLLTSGINQNKRFIIETDVYAPDDDCVIGITRGYWNSFMNASGGFFFGIGYGIDAYFWFVEGEGRRPDRQYLTDEELSKMQSHEMNVKFVEGYEIEDVLMFINGVESNVETENLITSSKEDGHNWICYTEGSATQIKNVKIYDRDTEETISIMLPAENENGEKGLYCTVRNIFLPIQTL